MITPKTLNRSNGVKLATVGRKPLSLELIPRTPLLLVIVLLLVELLLLGVYLHLRSTDSPEQYLPSPSGKVTSLKLGEFSVFVDPKENSLSVTDSQGRHVLKTVKGEEWVTVGRVGITVDEFDGGIYEFHDPCYPGIWHPKDDNPAFFAVFGMLDSVLSVFRRSHKPGQCLLSQKQVITGVEPNSDSSSVTIRGVVAGGRLEEQIGYQFVLSTLSSSPRQLQFKLSPVYKSGEGKKNKDSASLIDRITLKLAYDDENGREEAVYGFGETYTNVNVRGLAFPLAVLEQGAGRGSQPISRLVNLVTQSPASGTWFTTYAPIPAFMTSKSRLFLLENSEYVMWNLEGKTIAVESTLMRNGNNFKKDFLPVMEGYIGRADTPLLAVEELTLHTGRPPRLPKWIYHNGAIIGFTGGTKNVTDVHKMLKSNGVPIAAFWLQDWTGLRFDRLGSRLWWNWENDYDHYPGWEDLVASLKKENVKMMTYINPYLSNSVHQKKNARVNYFEEAKKLGYLVKTTKGEPYIMECGSPTFTYGMVDLSNPLAAQWYAQLIRCNMMKICHCADKKESEAGDCEPEVYGWMADFSESLPFDGVMYDDGGRDPVANHNEYPVQWQSLNRQATRDFPDVVPFTRAGWTKTPGTTRLLWHGDNVVIWDEKDGIKSVLRASITSGLTGLALAHSDIGGYTSFNRPPIASYIRSKELLLRWAEMSAFSDAVFRTHVATLPFDCHQVYSTPETAVAFGKMANIHKALAPYRDYLMELVVSRGWPMTRHMILQYPNDIIAVEMVDQFMMGECFLVAPILDPGVDSRRVYLPVGQWTHIWSGLEYNISSSSGRGVDTEAEGQYVTVLAPMGYPPAFLNRNAGIEVLEKCQSVAKAIKAIQPWPPQV